MKDPGNCFPITFSPLFGSSSTNCLARSVSGVKTGAPEGVWCTMWTRGADAERYLERRVEIALRVEVTFSVFKWPSAYLIYCQTLIGGVAEGVSRTRSERR